ncbi:MAG: phosphotransferase [Candidatus Aureabacteria bacterium]|nr:phosphotransferase [Candidatus Auribacterota bacterium]
MLLELHCHTNKHSSCSKISPVELAGKVSGKHLQGMVITEHRYLWTPAEISDLRKEASVGDDFLILSAQEVSTEIGHVLVFGAPESIEKETTLKELRTVWPDAALVWAHPFRDGRVPDAKYFLSADIDAVEIFSGNHTARENVLGLSFWHTHKFTAVAGSDTHSSGFSAILPTQFDHPVRGIKELAAEIKAGRCRPFFKEIPKSGSNITVTELTLGTKGDDEFRDRIILKQVTDAKKWKKLEESTKILQEVYSRGFGKGTFRVPSVIDKDEGKMLVMEEGQRGRSLFDLLVNINPDIGRNYFDLSAKWLARLHSLKLGLGSAGETAEKEKKRAESYLKAFLSTGNPHEAEAGKLIKFVKEREDEFFRKDVSSFIQNHGDYHPKNIIIGQDLTHDISTLFVSVIDFGNSVRFLKEYDIGYFLSQFSSQLGSLPGIKELYPEERFLRSYAREAGVEDGRIFMKRVNFFKIRANLSIAAYFIKVGKGDSPEMDRLMSESEDIYQRIA